MKYVAILLSCFVLTACVSHNMLVKLLDAVVPKAEDTQARAFIEEIRTGDYSSAGKQLDPSLQGEGAQKAFQQVHDLFNHGAPLAIEVIGCNITSSSSKRRVDLSYQLHFPDSWVAGDVVLDTKNNSTLVTGFHFNQITDSFEVLNRFALGGKSAVHYLVLAGCIASPCIILYALIACARAKVRRKWLWIIFILLGLMQIRLNWTTGAWNFNPFSVVLFGAGYSALGPYAPWILEFGFPIGAIIFLLRREEEMKSH
jgi:hypothetical protein